MRSFGTSDDVTQESEEVLSCLRDGLSEHCFFKASFAASGQDSSEDLSSSSDSSLMEEKTLLEEEAPI